MPAPPNDETAFAFDIVALGGNAVDRIVTIPRHPSPGEKVEVRQWRAQGGGRAATAMVVPARLGMRVRLLSGVGDDPEGAESLEGLRAEGIDTSGVRIRPGGMTQRAFILVDERTGERTILWGRGETIPLEPDEVDVAAIRSGRLFFTDAQNPHTSAKAALAANGAGIPVVTDLESVRPGLDDLLPLLDVLITSADFPRAATGTEDLAEAMRVLASRARGGRVIVTQGKDGAAAMIDGVPRTFPAYAVDTVDTTGAGDVFHGAFAAATILDLSLCDAIDFSNAVAAMKCLELGGRSAIPRSLEEIERFRRETDHRAGPDQ